MPTNTTHSNLPYPLDTDQIVDYPSVALSMASLLDVMPGRNAIINGAFDVWQRGASFANPLTGAYTADRWRLDHDRGAGASGTISKVANTQVIGTFTPESVLQFAGPGGAGAPTFQRLAQRIEDARTFSGQSVTLSYYVQAAAAITLPAIRVTQNFGSGGSPSAEVITTVATTISIPTGDLIRNSVTFSMPSVTGKTFGTTANTSYVQVAFDFGNLNTFTVKLWGVQLEQRTAPTIFERRHIQQELGLCQRYYFRTGVGLPENSMFGNGQCYATNGVVLGIVAPVQMRIVPSVMDLGAVGYFSVWNSVGSAITVTAIIYGTAISSEKLMRLDVSVSSGLTAGHVTFMIKNSAAGYIGFSAEL